MNLLILFLLADVTPPRVGVSNVQRNLTLAQAVELALKSNLEIEIEKTSTAAAETAARGARGYLDPVFRWLPSLERRDQPTGSVLFGADGRTRERAHTQNFSFRQRLPWQGSQFWVDFDNARQSTNNPFVSLNPYVASRLAFNFTQPLVRNRLIDRERAELRIRRKNLDLSRIDFELKTIDVITRVEQAYWDLVAARQEVQVRADNVEWAREQLARTKRLIDAGTLAPVELSAAEAELERRLDTWHAALATVTEAENALKVLLAPERSAALWSEEIVPSDVRTMSAPPELAGVGESVTHALSQRAELRAIQARQQSNDLERQENANQVRPHVNLVASYANTGLGGRAVSGDPFTDLNALLYQRVNTLSSRA